MNMCPHCKAESIRFGDKWLSSTAYPATCKQCNGISLVPVIASNGISLSCIAGLVVLGLVAAISRSAVPAMLGVPLIACFYIWRWKKTPLVPASPLAAQQARTAHWILIGTWTLLTALLR